MSSIFEQSPLTIAGLGVATSAIALLSKRYIQNANSDMGKLQKPAGGHWLWGHEGEAFLTADKIYSDNAETLGGAFAFKGALFHSDLLVLTDPVGLSHVYTKRAYSYFKGEIVRAINEHVVGKGLSWAEGDEHKRQRLMISPCFTPAKVKTMENDIRLAAEKLVSSIQAHVINNQKEKASRINLVFWTCRATLDIIGAIGFGHDFQCGQSPEAKQIFTAWNAMVSAGLSWGGFVAPVVLRALPFLAQLPLPALKEHSQIKNIVKTAAISIVEERARTQDQLDHEDLLSVLMRVSPEGDLDQLLEHVTTFVIAGHETTVTAINFALYELTKHKAAQDRLRQEITEFRGSGKGGEPTYDEYLSKLPFLDAVCKETLRMYPSASKLERLALEDDVIPLRNPVISNTGEVMHSIRVTKGQVITVPLIAINCSESVWGPNAREFVPERWLSPDTLPAPGSLTQGWSGIFTFGEGPRMCVGHRLATFEFKIILSTLLKNFEFCDTGVNISSKWSLTLQPFVAGREDEGVQLPIDVRMIS